MSVPFLLSKSSCRKREKVTAWSSDTSNVDGRREASLTFAETGFKSQFVSLSAFVDSLVVHFSHKQKVFMIVLIGLYNQVEICGTWRKKLLQKSEYKFCR